MWLQGREPRDPKSRRLIRRIWWITSAFFIGGIILGVVSLGFGIRTGIQADWDLESLGDRSRYWVVPLWLDLVAALIAFGCFSVGAAIGLARHLKDYPPSERRLAERRRGTDD